MSTGNFEIVNLLLDTKVCDVNAQNKAGYTSIMLAAVVPITCDYERQTLKRLFGEGNVNIKSTDSGQTALMLAVRHGNKDTVQLLLETGSDCNLQDKEGSTALMAACEHGHIDIVRLLLDNTTCDPDIKDNVSSIFYICIHILVILILNLNFLLNLYYNAYQQQQEFELFILLIFISLLILESAK